MPDPVVSLEGRVDPESEAGPGGFGRAGAPGGAGDPVPGGAAGFVLHDMFDLPFEEIALMVGRSATAARQLASRARRRVKGSAVPVDSDRAVNARSSTLSWPPANGGLRAPWFGCWTRTSCGGPMSTASSAARSGWLQSALGGARRAGAMTVLPVLVNGSAGAWW